MRLPVVTRQVRHSQHCRLKPGKSAQSSNRFLLGSYLPPCCIRLLPPDLLQTKLFVPQAAAVSHPVPTSSPCSIGKRSARWHSSLLRPLPAKRGWPANRVPARAGRLPDWRSVGERDSDLTPLLHLPHRRAACRRRPLSRGARAGAAALSPAACGEALLLCLPSSCA